VTAVDLVQWLTAQLDEDERIAREATPGPWVDQGGYVTDVGPDGLPRVQVTDYGSQDGEPEEDNPQGRADSAHIARHDPARVLAEVDAKRKLVERYERAMENRRAHPDDLASAGALLALHGAVKLLALPYADRSGYEEALAAFE
jgi:hypothetical protein